MGIISDQITELNENYNELGNDLVLLESVVLAMQIENEFLREYILSSLNFVTSSIRQHTKDICFLAKSLCKKAVPAIQKEAAVPPPLFNPSYSWDQTANHPD